MEKKFKSIIFLLLLLFFSFIIFSCKKNVSNNNNTQIKTDSEIVETNTLVFGEERKKSGSVQENTSNQQSFTEIENGDIKGQLFPIVSGTIIPEDMVIGSLLKYNIENLVQGTFPFAVITFFTDMGIGVTNEDLLHPSWSSHIQKLYSTKITEKFYTIRIGDIIDKNGIVSANIRLFTSNGRADGEVTADEFEGELLLSNISIDLDRLDEIYLRENLEYNPLSYSNLLLNY